MREGKKVHCGTCIHTKHMEDENFRETSLS